MSTPEQKEKKLSLFMDSSIMDDKNWKKEEVKHQTKQCIKLWEKMQEGMTYTRSPVLVYTCLDTGVTLRRG